MPYVTKNQPSRTSAPFWLKQNPEPWTWFWLCIEQTQSIGPGSGSTMGGCSAPNCSNSTTIGKQLFRFPKDAERRRIWAVNCRRDFEPPPHSRLCQDHFEPSQFEEVARSPAGGRKLRPNAIPTLFGLQEPPYPAITQPHFLLPLKPEPVERELGFEEHGYARHTPLPGMLMMMEEEEAEGHSEAHHCKQCLLLRRRLEQETHTSARLRKELDEMKKRLFRLDRMERGLQGFLYEDQVRALSLSKRSRRAVWSPETVAKAGKLRRAVGNKGYEYLRETGYPLPSYRTLCNRLETKITVTTHLSCEELAELGLGLMPPPSAYSPTGVGGVGEEEEEDDDGVVDQLIGVLS
ncbi:uncharacterized protein si:ch73-382f3.1 [Gadus morhua]|uniref:uncharacterized protein si:ch73-382f3.1 n=1 Tax=Gadus morhua TaxID=8049 RepID=UPI0011B7E002|nr:uncharacterized protein LOC115549156 [Gadus morhua]